jgi:hypothetical protein
MEGGRRGCLLKHFWNAANGAVALGGNAGSLTINAKTVMERGMWLFVQNAWSLWKIAAVPVNSAGKRGWIVIAKTPEKGEL